MEEITKSTPHEELVKAIPPAYFAGELDVSDFSARELCAIFALISQDDIGAVGQEMMERLQRPPVAVGPATPSDVSQATTTKVTHVFWRFEYSPSLSERLEGVASCAEVARAYCHDRYYTYLNGYWATEEREERDE